MLRVIGSVYAVNGRSSRDHYSLVHKVTLGPAFRCVTRSSEVCERDYAKPQLPLAPAEPSGPHSRRGPASGLNTNCI